MSRYGSPSSTKGTQVGAFNFGVADNGKFFANTPTASQKQIVQKVLRVFIKRHEIHCVFVDILKQKMIYLRAR